MDVQIPGYTIIRPIGKGGMATVFLAYQHNLERHVALKVLTPSLAANPDFVTRFMREAKIGASLCHRNIVPVFDVGHFPMHQYLAMEYLPNGDLKRRLVNGCDPATVLQVVYDVACALDYAHAKSYIHRDIKPANILFREDQTAVLTDFGIAVDLKSAAAVDPVEKFIAGSPQYMSPEQARVEPLDVRSDIYSLGAVLFEGLSGAPLLPSGATVADAVRCADNPVPRLPAEVSWLQPILERMLAKNRNERFNSMHEVARALEPCLKVPESLLRMPSRRPAEIPEPPVLNQRANRPEAFSFPGAAGNDTVAQQLSPEAPTRLTAKAAARMEPSSPTLIEDFDDDDLERALANCPPPVTTPSYDRDYPARRSWAGVLFVVLVLAAIPATYFYGPTVLEAMPQLADQFKESQPPHYSAGLQETADWEDREPPSSLQNTPAPNMPASNTPTTAAVQSDAAVALAAEAVQEPVAATAPPAANRTAALEAKTAAEVDALPATAAIPDNRPATAAVAAAKPAEPEPDPVEQLLQQAKDALDADDRDGPDVSGAYEKYREVLALDPKNKVARQGINLVAHKYLELASRALNKDELDDAQQYVDRASSIANRYRLGFQITQRIDDMQHTLNRIRHMGNVRTPSPWFESPA